MLSLASRKSTHPMNLRLLPVLLLGLLFLAGELPSARAQEPLNGGVAQELPKVDFTIGKATLHTEIASTSMQREIGLMYRTKMADNDGMIFIMPAVGPVTFWMKNTRIALSIAFVDKNGVILEIHDMQPEDFSKPHTDRDLPITHSESDQIAYALEANIHWFALNGIKPGAKLDPLPATLGGPKP